ncbi:MAG: GIY-YIG nuclease family protein [Alphaproteobacteria bacterium]|nr:GIY-YIG nuclease family protein [Alphaproteobacteria bacterium]
MFTDDDKIPIPTDRLSLDAATLQQAVYFVASTMARTGGAPEDYVDPAKQVLLELYKLGAVGRSNLFRWVPRRSISDAEMKRIIAEAGLESVYIFANAEGRHKVGKARDVAVRRRNLATGAAGGLRIVAEYKCPNFKAREVEKAAHSRLSTDKLTGEWFACDEATARAAVTEATAELYGQAIADTSAATASRRSL